MKLDQLKIIMLKGLPGSGKSTWAKEFVSKNPGYVRVNKDSLREMMASYRPGKDEDLILGWRDHFVVRALASKRGVIVDDTNFHPKHEARLKDIARQAQGHLNQPVGFEIRTFQTPLDQCIANDLKRPDSVGEKVIRKMWREYLYQKYEAPRFNPALPSAIICDLDGTLALHNGRSPYDTAKCDTDMVNPAIRGILAESVGLFIFVTGREEKYREMTQSWLFEKTGFTCWNLYMRPTGDFRKDDIVKEEIYLTQIMGKYNVRFVLDDRNRVVDMWRRNGLTCLQVAEGDF